MKEVGTVNRIEGQSVFIECGDTSACKGCSAGSFCKTKGREIEALNSRDIPLHSGDRIEIYLPPGRTIFSGFIVLIFPLLMFILAFVLTGTALPESDEGTRALFGLIGLAAGFGVSFLYNSIAKKKNFPEITKKLD